jgi:cytochrome oxidase Cu insertion factor (SCO1/SenC/PrrC family)
MTMRRFAHARRTTLLLLLLALPASGCFTPLAWHNPAALTSVGPPPDFTLPDETGQRHHLAALLARGPVVIVFYRGFW